MGIDIRKVWWEQVPNAAKLVNDINMELMDGNSVVIQHTLNFPWFYEFKYYIEEFVQEKNARQTWKEYTPNSSSAGSFILEEFCKKEKRAEYRPSIGYAKFFAESEDIVLHDNIIWLTLHEKSEVDDWLQLISDYTARRKQKDRDTALFLIEWCGQESLPEKKRIKFFSYDQYVGVFDSVVFCMLIASQKREAPLIKAYLANLAASVADNDVELCGFIVNNSEQFLRDPYLTLKQIVESEYRSNGEKFSIELNEKTVIHNIWLAQVKTIYPELETFREQFIQKYKKSISSIRSVHSTSRDYIYESPEEIELGALKYLVDNHEFPVSNKDRDMLNHCKVARDKLSHIDVVSLEDIRSIIGDTEIGKTSLNA